MSLTPSPPRLRRWKIFLVQKQEKIVGNMFETSGFLLKLHQKLCNPSVPSHKKIQTYMDWRL
jgi:hypothetical protein